MAKTLLPGNTLGTSYNAQASPSTSNFPIGVTCKNSESTISYVQVRFKVAGVLSKLYVYIISNTLDVIATFQTLKNTSTAGNLSISVAAAATGEFQDVSNTDFVAADDYWFLRLSIPAGTGVIGFRTYSFDFAATSNTVSILNSTGGVGYAISDNGVTMFRPIGGWYGGSSSTTESDAQIKMPVAGTFQYLNVNVRTNGRTTTTTVRFRKNGGNGNQVVSIGAGTTGQLEDTTHSDSVAIDDLVDIALEMGASAEAIYINRINIHFISTFAYGVVVTPIMNARNLSNLTYPYLGGPSYAGDTTEAQTGIQIEENYEWSDLQITVITNNITETTYVRSRVNGGNGNQVISIPSSTTGLFQDTSNSDLIVTDDQINYSLAVGGSGTTMSFGSISSIFREYNLANSERAAFLWGGYKPDDERSARLIGQILSSSDRNAKIIGKDTSENERGAKLTGELGDIFSRVGKTTLPTTSDNLSVIYSAGEISQVAADDDDYVPVDISEAGYLIHQYKKYNTGELQDPFTITIKAKSSLAPSSSTVYLQIFNRTTATWETLDTESVAGADIEFTLTGNKSADLGDYYDINYILVFRIYQQIT